MKTDIFNFKKTVISQKAYYLPLILITIITYGYTLFNKTEIYDNVMYSRYHSWPGVLLRSGRWGSVVLRKLLYNYAEGPFLLEFFCLCGLLTSTILICFLLYLINGKSESVIQYTVFSLLYITYPLIGEVWVYKLISLFIPMCFVVVTLIYLECTCEYNLKTIAISMGLFFPAAMGYEITYFVYITLTLMIIFLKYGLYESKSKGWLREGAIYAIPLLCDGALYIIIGKVLLGVCGLSAISNGERGINWIKYPLISVVKEMAYNIYYYFIRALEYMPIGVFVGGVLVFVIITVVLAVKQRSLKVIGFGALILISLFSVSIIRGSYMNYRTAWTIIIFVPFVGYLCINLLDKVMVERISNIRRVIIFRNIIVIVMIYLAFQQAIFLHHMFVVDNQRSENEMAIARQLGYQILAEYGEDVNCVFVGEIDLGDWVNSHIVADENSVGGSVEHYFRSIFTPGISNYRYTDSFILSTINGLKWNGDEYKQSFLQKYLSYSGYDISVDADLTYEELQEYEEYADEENMKPFEMKKVNDILVVNLG